MNDAEDLRPIEGEELDALMREICRRIDTDTQRIGDPAREQVWEEGWRDALERFRENPVAESLIPAFVRSGGIVRWRQAFYQPSDPDYELEFIRHLQADAIAPAMSGMKRVFEFGCGTGFNLVSLAPLIDAQWLHGFDRSISAVTLVNEAAIALGLDGRLGASQFDMLAPDHQVLLPPDSGVFTFGSVEQLAGRFESFIEWLIGQHPEGVLHIEPTVELYDPDNPVDALSIAFHRKRGYTEGLLPYLQTHPKVKMIHVERTYFGSLFHEGYTILVWKPR